MLKLSHLGLIFMLSSLQACSVTSVKTELPNDFASNAHAIAVEKPNWLFKDKFYNVQLGEYAVSNASISSLKKAKPEYLLKTEEYDNSLYNLFFKQKIDFQNITTKTIAETHSRKFSFDIVFSEENTFRSECEITSIAYKQEEKSTSSLSFGSKNKKRKPTIAKAARDLDWQSSNTECELTNNENTWNLSILAFKGKVPLVKLVSEESDYALKPLYASYGGSSYDRRIVQANNAQDFHDIQGRLFGIETSRNEAVVSNVSLDLFNDNTIWLDNNLGEKEANFLLGVNHTLVMASWLDDFAR